MEPIPYFFESIDRNAVIVKPKKPFYDWIDSVFPDDDPSVNRKDEFNIYLVQEMDSNEQVRQYVELNFEMIFANELNDWYSDEDKWPANRTSEMFFAWFELEINSMILDLEEYEVTKE
jgi:hypothetical protein